MKLIKAIYDAPSNRINKLGVDTYVEIKFNNQRYVGVAFCHPDDNEYHSPKVGYNIALSRARLKILNEEFRKAKKIEDAKYKMYQEVLNYGHKSAEEIDPTGAFLKNVTRAQDRTKAIYEALKKEKQHLRNYLRGQDKFIKSIKNMRQHDKNN